MGILAILCSAIVVESRFAIGSGNRHSSTAPEMELPPTLVGHGRMKGTPPVPDDMRPVSRPKKELFLTLPSEDLMLQIGIGMCCRLSLQRVR